MKIAGKEYNSLNEDVLVLPRSQGDIVFRGRAIADFEEFNELCPAPLPPTILTRKGKEEDHEDEGFKQQKNQYSLRRMAWMVIKTLEPSDIEWDTIDMEKPSTWGNWVDEMSKVLSPGEQQRLLNFVLQVNCLDEAKVEQARADFLRGLGPDQPNG